MSAPWPAHLRTSHVAATRRLRAGVAPRFVMLMLAAVTIGCETGDTASQNETGSAGGDAVRSEVERGPVKFSVEVSPAKPQLSDQPQLTLTLRAERGVRIEKPPFGAALGDFLIRDFYEPPALVDEQSEVIQQIYTLEPTRAGQLTVAPIAVRFYDERDRGDAKPHTIESEALTVDVRTMLGDQAPTLADLRPLAGPVELPASAGWAWLWGVAIFAAVAMAAMLVRKTGRRQLVSAPQKSPQELAWLELELIVERKLAETDVKEFYVELTGVVRRYIERSTGVHAPEQTTEEFLREIVADALFAEDDRRRLRDFLESADLVKFAAVRPGTTDIEASFARAQEFIRLKRSTAAEVAA